MEFELDDYRTGKKTKKKMNLNCIYDNKNNIENEKNNKMSKMNSATEKPIYINSKNNNYLITKLRKENENLKLMLYEYESNYTKNKMKEKKIKKKKLDNNTKINRNASNINRQQLISKMFNDNSNSVQKTYTSNFYNMKNKKKSNLTNNSKISDINNNTIINQNFSNTKILPTSSYIIHNKKSVKSKNKKSLSAFRSASKSKSQKDKNNINRTSRNTRNNGNNKSINDISSQNAFTWKKNSNLNNIVNGQSNIMNTERNEINYSNSNLLNSAINNIINRNEYNFIPKKEFNLTWSRINRKDKETTFQHFLNRKNKQKIIMSTKITKKIENLIENKFMKTATSRPNNSVGRFDNSNLKDKTEISPQKITINRKKIADKMKNHKKYIGSNNISMKNIANIHQKNKKNEFKENKNINQNSINCSENIKFFNLVYHSNIHEGEIYSKKKGIH